MVWAESFRRTNEWLMKQTLAVYRSSRFLFCITCVAIVLVPFWFWLSVRQSVKRQLAEVHAAGLPTNTADLNDLLSSSR